MSSGCCSRLLSPPCGVVKRAQWRWPVHGETGWCGCALARYMSIAIPFAVLTLEAPTDRICDDVLGAGHMPCFYEASKMYLQHGSELHKYHVCWAH